MGRVRAFLWAVAAVSALGTTAAYLGGLGWPFSLASHFHHYWALAGLALIGGFGLTRDRIGMPVAAALAGLNLAVTVPPLVGDGGAARAAADRGPGLTLLTFNLWSGNRAFADVETDLRAEDADLVALVEAGPTAAPMLARLGDLYPHRVDCSHDWFCGLVLLSKRPLDAPYAGHLGGAEDLPVVTGVLTVDGKRLTVTATHLLWPLAPGVQEAQAATLSAYLGALAGPSVVMGDFNAAPWSHLLRRLRRETGYRHPPGFKPTWPSGAVSVGVPIDHVLGSPQVLISRARVGPDLGSDHRPLSVRLHIE